MISFISARRISDVPFRLLFELVVELKKGNSVWLVKDIEVGGYQGVDRLRKTIEGYLLEKDAKKIIENNGSKRYRIEEIAPRMMEFLITKK